MQTIAFTKMHGTGNDYIYVNTLLYNVADPSRSAIAWSNRHTGIGSDGLVLIGSPLQTSPQGGDSRADFSMRIFNADGSEGMMCGNACRCIGKYLYERGLTEKREIRLQTLSGVKTLRLNVADGRVESVTVDMGVPALHCPKQYVEAFGTELTVASRTFKGTFVSMGNPHFVVFTDDVEAMDVRKYGPLIERHEAFPGRCNVEFAQMQAASTIRMRVWERGSGITMACGTGACATAVAAALTGRSGRQADIVMDGGTLTICWSEQDGHVYMTGPAEFVFDGEILAP